MHAMLHGFRHIDMTDRETGRLIVGYTCFISFPSEGVQGLETAKQFISDGLAAANGWKPVLGELLNIEFTPKGRVSSVSTVQEK